MNAITHALHKEQNAKTDLNVSALCPTSDWNHLNSITTKVPLWEDDCERFGRRGVPFVLRDVTSAWQVQFIKAFSAHAHFRFTRHDTTVLFEPGLPHTAA